MRVSTGSTVIEFTPQEIAVLKLWSGKTGGPHCGESTLTTTLDSRDDAERVRAFVNHLYDALKV